MTILSQLRLKNVSLNFSLISQTFQFRVSMPLVFSMLAAILLSSNIISFLMNNYEQLFLNLLGWLMMFLSIYVANFFKASFKRSNLLVFLFLGILMGYFLQELNINSGAVSPLYLFISGVIAFSFFPSKRKFSVCDPSPHAAEHLSLCLRAPAFDVRLLREQ